MKKLLIIIVTIFCSNAAAQQDIETISDVKQLYNLVDEYQNSKNYIPLMQSLLRIIELDSTDKTAKYYLAGGLRGYFNEISQYNLLMDQILDKVRYLDDLRVLPVGNLINYYYTFDRYSELEDLLTEITEYDTNKFKIVADPLFDMDQKKLPEFYSKILMVIRPYVRHDKHSVRLLFALHTQDALYEFNKFEQLFEKEIHSTICNDSLELSRFLNFYINRNPQNSLNIIEDIFYSYKDCFEQNDPLGLAMLYYNSGNKTELISLIEKIEQGQIKFKSHSLKINSIDPNLEPDLARRLLSIYWSNIPANNLNRTEYIKYLYDLGLYSELFVVLDRMEREKVKLDVSLNSFLDIDISRNMNIAGKIYQIYWKHFPKSYLQSYTNVFMLYDFTKLMYKTRNYYQIDIILNRINEILTKEEKDFKTLVIKGITSLLLKNDMAAQISFSQIISWGYREEKEYLASELKWWSSEISSELLNRTISTLSDFLIAPEKSAVSADENLKEDKTTELNSKDQTVKNSVYHALLIGVKDYKESKLNLVYPLTDVNSLAAVLRENYTFDEQNIRILENPTRAEIFRSLIDYKNRLGEKDNLLIFYAGHGWWDEDMQQGYWLPSNAELDIRANWITNSELTEQISIINTRHTLLITDACFSGSIFKTRSLFVDTDKNMDLIYKMNSRKAITSGTLISVPDKSVFIEYLLKRLEDNDEILLPAEKLYLNFRDAVTNNSIYKQRPLYGVIWNSGDEGGDFIFVKRNADE